MKNSTKLIVFFISLIINYCVLLIILENTNEYMEPTLIIIMKVCYFLSSAILSLAVLGVTIQTYYNLIYKAFKKVEIKNNTCRQFIFFGAYFGLLILFVIVKIGNTELQLLPIAVTFALYKPCLKCNTYFIIKDTDVLYLDEIYSIYKVNDIKKEDNYYTLLCHNEKDQVVNVRIKGKIRSDVQEKLRNIQMNYF